LNNLEINTLEKSYFVCILYIAMKRPVRGNDGKYNVHGKSYKELFGSRTQVHNGTAYKTPGGLTKSDLMMNKWGRIVSAKKHRTAKKEKRLEKAGYFTKKGKFGFVKRATRKMHKKMRGGKTEGEENSTVPVGTS
jgi:hypothetical protein